LEIISKLRNKEELFKIFKKRNEDRAKGKRLKPIEFKIETMNGDVKWLFWQSNVLRLKNNNLIQVIVQDFTERKKVEQLIIEENKKLLELDEIKNEIINRFSHELKTPLTSIFGAIDLLQSQIKGKLTEEESELLQHINYGSIKLRELIFKMIDSMRLDKTEIRLSFQETDIIRIIRNSYEELKYFCESRNLNIILNLPETYYFKADEERIKQVFSNLISNAIKNTPPYGVITLDLIDGDKYCDLIIKDTGVGFTDAEIKNLFQKFGKIERYGMNLDVDNEGMGLGLFISKKIIEMHNGEILVESEGRNKGSMFTIRLFK
jgi:signal transduction histidine kinase